MTADGTAQNGAYVTLQIGRTDSRCGACGKPALPYDERHTTPCGYAQQPGCGALWTHVTSVYVDPASEAAVREMRPDLIFIPAFASDDSGTSGEVGR